MNQTTRTHLFFWILLISFCMGLLLLTYSPQKKALEEFEKNLIASCDETYPNFYKNTIINDPSCLFLEKKKEDYLTSLKEKKTFQHYLKERESVLKKTTPWMTQIFFDETEREKILTSCHTLETPPTHLRFLQKETDFYCSIAHYIDQENIKTPENFEKNLFESLTNHNQNTLYPLLPKNQENLAKKAKICQILTILNAENTQKPKDCPVYEEAYMLHKKNMHTFLYTQGNF